MSEAELDEIRAAARRSRLNVSDWVRNVLREERERQRTRNPAVVREAPSGYGTTDVHEVGRVRVELDLKESLLASVQARYRLPSRRAAVEFALRRAAVQPMSKAEVLEMESRGWEGDLDELRAGDPGALW